MQGKVTGARLQKWLKKSKNSVTIPLSRFKEIENVHPNYLLSSMKKIRHIEYIPHSKTLCYNTFNN
jgi:hypothetical protein